MKFQGDIASIPITDVAQNLSSNRKAGMLTIHRGGDTRHIAFQDGKIVSYTDSLGFSVPKWLEEKGVVPPEQLRKIVQKCRKSKSRDLGQMLQRAGLLPEEEYRHHLKG